MPKRPTLPFYISPAELQLHLAIDTLQKYETLYRNERMINASLRATVAVDERQLARRDSLNARLDSDLTQAEAANQALLTENETLAANLDETTSQLETSNKKLRKYEARTKAGKAIRTGVTVAGIIKVLEVVFHFLPL